MEDRYWANVHLRAIARRLKAQHELGKAHESLWKEYACIVGQETAEMEASLLVQIRFHRGWALDTGTWLYETFCVVRFSI